VTRANGQQQPLNQAPTTTRRESRRLPLKAGADARARSGSPQPPASKPLRWPAAAGCKPANGRARITRPGSAPREHLHSILDRQVRAPHQAPHPSADPVGRQVSLVDSEAPQLKECLTEHGDSHAHHQQGQVTIPQAIREQAAVHPQLWGAVSAGFGDSGGCLEKVEDGGAQPARQEAMVDSYGAAGCESRGPAA